MKYLLFGLLVFAVLQIATLQSNDEILKRLRDVYSGQSEEEQAMNKIKTQMESICPGHGHKFENATKKVVECWEEADETSNTMCALIKSHGEKCSKPFIDELEQCVPQRSREVPKLIVNMIMSGVKHLCGSDGEHIFELANPCFKTNHYQTSRCLRVVRAKIQSYANESPSKSEVCDTLGSLRGCLQSHLQTACGSPKTREAFTSLFDAVKSPCDDSKSNEVESVESV